MDNWHTYKKQNTVKLIAIVLMLIDHIGSLVGVIELRIVGHLGITIFLYSFVTGLKLSRGLNFKKTIILLAMAVISQPFYMYLFSSHCLNIMFVYLLYYIFKYTESKQPIINAMQFVLFCGLAMVLNIEYSYFGFSMLYIIDKLESRKCMYAGVTLLNISFVIFGVVVMKTWIFILQPIALIIIHVIDNDQFVVNRKINKHVFYVFYPAHLIVLSVIKIFF